MIKFRKAFEIKSIFEYFSCFCRTNFYWKLVDFVRTLFRHTKSNGYWIIVLWNRSCAFHRFSVHFTSLVSEIFSLLLKKFQVNFKVWIAGNFYKFNNLRGKKFKSLKSNRSLLFYWTLRNTMMQKILIDKL